MKRKLPWIFFTAGLGFLALYLVLLFKTDRSALIVTTLVLSIGCNVTALNLFYSAWQRKRRG